MYVVRINSRFQVGEVRRNKKQWRRPIQFPYITGSHLTIVVRCWCMVIVPAQAKNTRPMQFLYTCSIQLPYCVHQSKRGLGSIYVSENSYLFIGPGSKVLTFTETQTEWTGVGRDLANKPSDTIPVHQLDTIPVHYENRVGFVSIQFPHWSWTESVWRKIALMNSRTPGNCIDLLLFWIQPYVFRN